MEWLATLTGAYVVLMTLVHFSQRAALSSDETANFSAAYSAHDEGTLKDWRTRRRITVAILMLAIVVMLIVLFVVIGAGVSQRTAFRLGSAVVV
jgi:hypothetical protein